MPLTEFQLTELKHSYQILGVPLSASAHSIKQSYRRLAKRWHPDRHAGIAALADATHMMKLINEAYSKIEHAPLRYYIEAIPLAQRSTRPPVHTSTGKPSGENTQTFPNTDRIEFWVRFVCVGPCLEHL